MTTKEEVIAALETSEARVDRLAPDLLAHPDAKLVDSEWTVWQALCHVAARSNALPLATRLAERIRAAQAEGQPINWRGSNRGVDINQAQIDERQGRGVPELLSEIHAGHQAAMAAVRGLSQESFDERFPRFTGEGEMSMGELLMLSGSGHENGHLDQIEQAIEAAAPAK
jgi:hypothetical protein